MFYNKLFSLLSQFVVEVNSLRANRIEILQGMKGTQDFGFLNINILISKEEF